VYDAQANIYILLFRSTELASVAEGGDRERDLLGGSAEIGPFGFIFGQLAAMEHYGQLLKASEHLPAGYVPNVTDFSLSEH